MKSNRRIFLLSFLVLVSMKPLLAQWVQTNWPGGVALCFAVSDTNLFAGTWGGGVFLSTNNGTSWTMVNNGLTNTNVRTLTVSGTNLFAGTDGGVFLSTNNGTNWNATNNGLTNTVVHTLTDSGTNLFAGTDGGVFLSINNGSNWTQVNNGLTDTVVHALAGYDTNLFAGTSGGVYRSTNNGTNWIAVNNGLTYSVVYSLTVSGTNLFAGTSGSVARSTNNGTSWVNTLVTYSDFPALTNNSANLFAGGYYGIFLSTNNGTNWVNVGSMEYVQTLAVYNQYLFAGATGGVWKRPLSEMITSVELLPGDSPTQFSLSQNYPNPFNPATTISFSIPSKSFVLLKVFDVLGKEISTLVSEELSAGTYSQQWNAGGLPTGVYLYSLQAGSFTETKKLMLLR